MKRLSASASIIALAASVSPALAETAAEGVAPDRDYLPKDIVVMAERDGYSSRDGSSATKTPTPIIDVPQAITTITADQLEDQAITQLNDALRYVPGISLDTGEGHRDAIFIRGQSTTADFYLDGLRDDAQYYRSLYNIERVEILKGANALMFGRGGGGGIVNRVSKTAQFEGTEVGFNGSVDSQGAFALSADLNQLLADTVAARLNTTYEEFDSFRDFVDGRFIGISPTVTSRLGEATRLVASYTYDDDSRVTDRGIPSLGTAPLEGHDRTFFGSKDFNRATNVAHIARARLEHEFSSDLSINVTGQFADYDKYYANVVPTGTDGTTVDLGGYTSATDRQNWIGQANLVWATEFGRVGSTFLAGIEAGNQDSWSNRTEVDFGGGVEDITVDLQRVLDVPAVTVGSVTRENSSELSTFSAYAQEQLDFGALQLIGGLRYDRFDLTATNLGTMETNSRVDEKVSPRFGLVVKPDRNFSLYASWSTSFLPQSGDQFTTLGDVDAELKPEEFENLELGVKYAPHADLLLTAAVFRLDRSNTTADDPLNPGFVILTGSSRVEGVELSIAGEVLPDWQASLGYTYLDGEIRSDTENEIAGTALRQLPKHQIALWNRLDLTDSLGLGLGVVHQSKQFASTSNTVELPAYWRVDAAAYVSLSEQVSLQLNVENLFDETYYASAHGDNNIQPGKPLTARIGVRLGF